MGIFSRITAKSNLKSGKKLLESALGAQGDEADRLFTQACSKFEAVVDSGALVVEGLHQWALALNSQAKTRDGQEAEDLLNQSYTKYTAALVIEPKNHEILNDWGATIMDHARALNADPDHALYQQAKEKFLAAGELFPGISAYNLACINSLHNDLQSCEEQLNAAWARGNLPPLDYIKADSDLVNISQSEWFQEFLESKVRY